MRRYLDFSERVFVVGDSTRSVTKDGIITQALCDRFAPGARNKGKGTKKEPGFFYGFSADVWQAFAVADAWLIRSSKTAA